MFHFTLEACVKRSAVKNFFLLIKMKIVLEKANFKKTNCKNKFFKIILDNNNLR